MNALSPHAVLHRAPELVVEIDSSDNVKVHHDGRGYLFGHDALGLLDVFSGGCTVGEALARMAPRLQGRRAVEDALACVAQMYRAGVLAEDGHVGFSELSFPRGGYDASYVQIRMLQDTARKRAFLDAIREVVRPDDVVLDLGTGSGILAVAAAQAGARQVYAVEPTNVIRIAELVARDNGVADRITFVRGWSTQVDLPESATVVTTDILGNESLDMRVWEMLHDARQRLLTPDATLIPAGVSARVCLVSAPPAVLREYRPDREHVRAWHDAYGIDFGALVDATGDGVVSFYAEPALAAGWGVLSEPVVAYELDFSAEPAPFATERELTVSRPGVANALLSFFEARLSPSSTLSTAPWHGSEASHWFCACWTLEQPSAVEPGDRLAFRYEYRGDGRSVVTPLAEVPA